MSMRMHMGIRHHARAYHMSMQHHARTMYRGRYRIPRGLEQGTGCSTCGRAVEQEGASLGSKPHACSALAPHACARARADVCICMVHDAWMHARDLCMCMMHDWQARIERPWQPDEDRRLDEAIKKLGNKWKAIAGEGGREGEGEGEGER